MKRCKITVLLLGVAVNIAAYASAQSTIDASAPSGAKDSNAGAVARGDATAELIAQLADESPRTRVRAAQALGQLGAPARNAGPALGKLLSDSNVHVRRAAIQAFRRIHPDPQMAVPLLVEVAADADSVVRLNAMDGLAELGKSAVPGLIEATKNPQTAYSACLALGQIGAVAAPAVPALVQLLGGEGGELRREAALSLGAIGPGAEAAVPSLIKLLEDPDYGVRLGAVFAVGRIGPAAKAADAALQKLAMTNPPALLRALLVWAMARVKPEDKAMTRKAVSILCESMRSQEPRVRATALRGLGDLHTVPDVIVPAMKRLLDEGPTEVRDDALTVLASVGEPAVPALTAALQQSDVRLRAIEMLGRLGPKAAPAAGALVGLLKSDDPVTCREALRAIGAIGPAARSGVPAITKALRDRDITVRYTACLALGKMGTAAASAKPSLEQQLVGKDTVIAMAAAWALARIDPEDGQASPKSVPQLIDALQDREPIARLEAATSLRSLGPDAKSASEALRKTAQEDPNELIRDMAHEALDAIGE